MKIKQKPIDLFDPAQVFTTNDLGLSAALLCADFELVSLDKANPRRVLFIFRRTLDIEVIANSYFSDHLRVSARSFFDQLKALKSRLYSE
jgi:hypothetical protein